MLKAVIRAMDAIVGNEHGKIVHDMKLKILNTGSQGNCYILDGQSQALVLEAGVKAKKVLKAVGYDPLKVCGLLVSHDHKDHSKYLREFQLEFFGDGFGISDILKGKTEFAYWEYEVSHDIANAAFLIEHPEMGHLFYLSDASHIPVKINGLNHLLIEANFSESILEANVQDGKVNEFLANRIRENHLSIERLEHWLTQIDISQLKTITLCHLSNDNSDEKDFQERISKLTGVSTFVAKKNMEVEL